MKRIIVLFCILCSAVVAQAQSQKQWLRYADESYKDGDYYGASLYYRNAMLLDSSDLYIVYQYAESLRQYNEYEKAEYYYEYVWNKDKGKDYKECMFWLATMQKYNAKYIQARKNFSRYTKINTNKKSFFFKKATQEMGACEYVLTVKHDSVKVEIKNIGDTTRPETSVNTINSEFNATPLNDSVIYFSSLRSEKMRELSDEKDKTYWIKVYEAEKTDTAWFLTSELDTTINKEAMNTANTSLSADQKTIYLSRCDAQRNCQIYISKNINGEWQSAIKLPDSINYPGAITTQPFITVIDSVEVLFFVSDRPGGKGRMDIWKSEIHDGVFMQAKNLGTTVNSIDDEITPVYENKTNTLYFSSAWHYGLGGFDIFSSKKEGKGFKTPVNMGYPYNSSVNDLYYTINPETNVGFLTSNRKGSMYRESETCCNDIWSFKRIVPPPPPPVVKDTVKKISDLEKLMSYLPVKLYFHNDEPNPKTRDTVSSKTYLESYQEYKSLQEDYQKNYSQGLKGEAQQAAIDTINAFFTNHVDKGVQDLEQFTDLLYAELLKGYKLDVLVKGHASSLAKTDYNVPLTLRRISSLELFLRSYKDGVMLPYLEDSAGNGGSLKIIRLPFGEYKAQKNMSDNLYDQKNSVYSVSAAESRNIEIVSVTLSHKDSMAAEMRFLKKEVFDFGSSIQGQVLKHIFKFKNTGKAPLIISSIQTSCTCITVKGPTEAVAPGERGDIEVTLDTKELKGKEFHSVSIYTNGIPIEKELSVTTEVH
ncbi:MAG TPA: DUF1573 domain-containing protein [Cytophagaceae bacterium]|nr:DUF1573 domain-containing protein [Cytophagaceae bacterium]